MYKRRTNPITNEGLKCDFCKRKAVSLFMAKARCKKHNDIFRKLKGGKPKK